MGFSSGKFGLLFLGKASCDRVALPNLRCMLDVFSVSIIHPNSDMDYRILNVRTDVTASDCTRECADTPRGLWQWRIRFCTENGLWEKIPLPNRRIEPASEACPSVRSDAVPAELHPPYPSSKTIRNINTE